MNVLSAISGSELRRLVGLVLGGMLGLVSALLLTFALPHSAAAAPVSSNPRQQGTTEAAPVVEQVDVSSAEDPALLKVYAHVNTKDSKVPVYPSPQDAISNTNPLRELNGYEWVTVIGSTELNGIAFTQINSNEWIYADRLAFFRPSRFQGSTFDQTPDRPIAWVLAEFQPTLEPDGETNTAAPVYKRYEVVTIYEKALVGPTMWYRIGEQQWCPQQRLGVVTPQRAPEGVSPRDQLHSKWISVNLYEQTIAAYEGERLVYASLVSSGLPRWETVKGVFQIQAKNRQQPMYNGAGDPNLGEYYLEEVPYNMFFFEDYALHGAYWHDGFGFKKSRGCVNLSIMDARWFFNWTQPSPSEYGYAQAGPGNPGTWLWVQ